MKKYNELITEQKDMSSYEEKEKSILGCVKDIIMYEEGISEKNFSFINAMNQSFDKFMPSIRSMDEYHDDIKSFDDKRKQYAAEFVYAKYFMEKFKISM